MKTYMVTGNQEAILYENIEVNYVCSYTHTV